MINPNFVFIGVALQCIGGMSYVIDTVKGRVQPNKVTWFLWSVSPLVAFAASLSQGVGIQALATFIVGFIPLVVFIASFVNKKASWKLGRIDILCGIFAVLGLVMWYVTKVGNVAIAFSIVADCLAGIPTLIKAYRSPDSESDFVYFLGIANTVIALLAVRYWNFESYGFQTYILIMNSLLVFCIRSRIGVAKT